MSRPKPFILFSILLATLAGFAWLGLRHGALLISAHEGDTYHLLDILFRLQGGMVAHVDFMTPLGVLSFLPIEVFMAQGYGVGQSILWSQVLVAATLFPAIFYTSWSRLTPKVGYAFAAFTMAQILALSFGGTEPGLSISMHYNRWAWAVGFIVILLAFAPARGAIRPTVDGVVIGLGLSALVLLKVTFFVALLPGVALVLFLQNMRRTIAIAVATGVVVAVAATLVLGGGFWQQYIGDLLVVSASDIRPFPSVPLSDLLTQSKTLAITIVGFLIYLLVSRAGHRPQALGLLLLIPGCFYITYQNFGNDPKWLVPLIALMIALRPEQGARIVNGTDLYTAVTAVSLAGALLFLPSAVTMTMSPLRHMVQDVAAYEPMLPAQPDHQDIMVRADRGYTMTAQLQLDVPGSAWARYRDLAERNAPLEIAGVQIPQCEILAGSLAWLTEFERDLAEADLPTQSTLFVTDILAALWLFGDFAPLPQGAPWYYGNLSGLEIADYILVPKCGFVTRIRNVMIRELIASDIDLAVVRDNELYVLFRLSPG